jgi:hypothetical protein
MKLIHIFVFYISLLKSSFQLDSQHNLNYINDIQPGFDSYIESLEYFPISNTTEFIDHLRSKTFKYQIYQSINEKNYLLFAKKDNYSGSTTLNTNVLPESGDISFSFDHSLIQIFKKPATLENKFIKKIKVSVSQNNCEFLYGIIRGDQFEPKMKRFAGNKIKNFMIDNGFNDMVNQADPAVFDFNFNALNLMRARGKNIFPETISSENLEYKFKNRFKSEDFYLICPYYSSSTPNVSVLITPTYEEIPEKIILEETKDCSTSEDTTNCKNENSKQIKEYLNTFDDTERNIFGSKIKVEDKSESNEELEETVIELNEVGSSEKEFKITSKLGMEITIFLKNMIFI